MTRLLLLTGEFEPFKGGIGTYTKELARAATALGVSVTVAAPDYGEDQSALDSGFPFEVIRYRAYSGSGFKRVMWNARLINRLYMSRNEFDIVHAVEWPFFAPLALSMYRFFGKARCMITVYGTEITGMASKRNAFMLRALHFYSDWLTIVSISRFTTELARRALAIPRAMVVKTVPLGVSAGWFKPIPDRPGARVAMRLQPNDFAIITTARIVPRKGHLLMIEALKLLDLELRERVVWLIAGQVEDQIYEAKFKAALSDVGCRVRLLGRVDDDQLRTAIDASDLFCLTGIWNGHGPVEGFGLVYLEAGARGIPSLGTAIGGVPDAIDHNVTGVLTETDPSAIAAELSSLMTNADQLRTLAAGALARAKASTWASVASATYEHSGKC